MKYKNKKKRAVSLTVAAVMLGTMCSALPQVSALDPISYGDLDKSGTINAADLTMLKQGLLGSVELDALTALAADVDADNAVTAADAVMLQEYLLGKRKDFPEHEAPPVSYQQRYYAIEAEYENAWEEDTNEGFAGKAYVNYDNSIGGYINWTVDVPEAGNYKVTFRYANSTNTAGDERACQVSVNGASESVKVNYPSTGAWTTWEEVSIVVTLKAGKNTIKATAVTATGGPNVDYIELEKTDDPANEPTKQPKPGAIRMENLDRGVVAANTGKGILVSWRILGEDDENTRYEVYKNGEAPAIYVGTKAGASCYLDASGTTNDWYTVDVYQGDTCTEFACFATQLYNFNTGTSGAYIDINMTAPANMTMPDGSTCSYSVNDCSVGDVDGDGVYEIFVKWDPSNSKDNAQSGYTGNVYIDCYKLDGTRLWRIDLGRNIRAGAHYTQFMVYDFDGDNCAEMICKTADATVDGKGNVIGDKNADYRTSSGTVLSGPEYITLFDGQTGAALDTQDYDPGRGTATGSEAKSTWGDDYGNRCERYTACVAYLGGSGETASAIFGRGYYTRQAVAAWDVKNGKLVKRWVFDTGFDKNVAGYGDGNHHKLAADVDGDGKQEIVCGAAVIDDNGKLLYTTGNAHGDAMHIGDFDPANPGLEIFQCLEDEKSPTGKAINFGTELRDAATGKVLFRETSGDDTGRCIADNLIPGNAGAEIVGIHNSIIYSATGNHERVALWSDITKWGQNSVVYWDGTLEREVLDRTMVDGYGKGRLFTGNGVTYNNGSKSNAALTCDLFGDWREELIFPLSADVGTGVRIFTTTYTTEYGIVSLMHNPQYRVQVAAQNNGYNQPPHLDYFLGTGFEIPENPAVYTE